MTQFIYFPTPAFTVKMEKIEKHDRPGHTRILGVIERLLVNPTDADGWMHGEHHGRLIYHWCELCRKEGKKLEEQCGFCHEVIV